MVDISRFHCKIPHVLAAGDSRLWAEARRNDSLENTDGKNSFYNEGAGKIVMPTTGADGEKTIGAAKFGSAKNRALKNKVYLDSAQQVSESMRQYWGAKGAADEVETFAADVTLVHPC